jgi:hypothetical protein
VGRALALGSPRQADHVIPGKEWVIPLTPGEYHQLNAAAAQSRRMVRISIDPPPRLIVRGEQDRWAVELLASMRGLDVRELYVR